jgi:hypothetical protein
MNMISKRKFILAVLIAVSLSLSVAMLVFIYRDQGVVVIQGPTELYSKPYWVGAPGNSVVAVLQKGDRGKVISIRYSKDFKFYEIQLGDGRSGYIISGDHFIIEKH